jgi:hypothetical protein
LTLQSLLEIGHCLSQARILGHSFLNEPTGVDHRAMIASAKGFTDIGQ